jgi:hypothetical protein
VAGVPAGEHRAVSGSDAVTTAGRSSGAHWLGGQYLPLYGRRPEGLVVAPTQAQLMLALDRELEHLERHAYEDDAENPYEATYAVFNAVGSSTPSRPVRRCSPSAQPEHGASST